MLDGVLAGSLTCMVLGRFLAVLWGPSHLFCRFWRDLPGSLQLGVRPVPVLSLNNRTKYVNRIWRFLEKLPIPIHPFSMSFCIRFA